MPDLVVFDCDGVLVDSEVLAGEALRAVHRAHGIEVSAELFTTIIGMKAADGLAALARATGGRCRRAPRPSSGRRRPPCSASA